MRLLTLTYGPFSPEAFFAWAGDTDFDAIGAREMRLMPELGARLQAHGIRHPYVPRITGLGRRAFYINARLLRCAEALALRLAGAGMEPLFSAGGAMVLRSSRAAFVRPLTEIDLLLPPDAGADAAVRAALSAADLSLFSRQDGYQCYRDDQGHFYRLFWRLPPLGAADWPALFDTSLSVVRGAGQVRAIAPEAQMLALLWAGMAHGGPPPAIWVADVIGILQDTPGFDWPKLVDLTGARGGGEALGALLACLDAAGFGSPEMTAARDRLASRPDPWPERWLMRQRTRPVTARSARLVRLVLSYLADTRQRGERPGPATFRAHLRARMQLAPSRSLTGALWARAIGRNRTTGAPS